MRNASKRFIVAFASVLRALKRSCSFKYQTKAQLILCLTLSKLRYYTFIIQSIAFATPIREL